MIYWPASNGHCIWLRLSNVHFYRHVMLYETSSFDPNPNSDFVHQHYAFGRASPSLTPPPPLRLCRASPSLIPPPPLRLWQSLTISDPTTTTTTLAEPHHLWSHHHFAFGRASPSLIPPPPLRLWQSLTISDPTTTTSPLTDSFYLWQFPLANIQRSVPANYLISILKRKHLTFPNTTIRIRQIKWWGWSYQNVDYTSNALENPWC